MDYIGRNLDVATIGEQCVLNLPLITLDNRKISIFVERKIGDSYLVHDGGQNVAELFVQGISLGENRMENLAHLAKAFGATLSNEGIFEKLCSKDEIQSAILAVSQCAALTMGQSLGHQAVIEDERLESRINRTLQKWKPEYIQQISRGVSVRGTHSTHKFDFVSHPFETNRHNTVAIAILNPTYGAKVAADRYGFLALDIAQGYYSQWTRLAVLQKYERWTPTALTLISALSADVLKVSENNEAEVESALPAYMDELTA